MKFEEEFANIIEKVDLKGTTPEDYDPKMLKKGSAVEKEHTDSQKKAEKIAMQHTAEFPKETKDDKITTDYYEQLDKIEKILATKKKKSFDAIVKDVKESMGPITETSMAGAGGVFGNAPSIGGSGGVVGNVDSYATGDARMPKSLFGTVKSGGKKKKKGIPVVRRTPAKGM